MCKVRSLCLTPGDSLNGLVDLPNWDLSLIEELFSIEHAKQVIMRKDFPAKWCESLGQTLEFSG